MTAAGAPEGRSAGPKRHSIDYLGDERDDWWNADYLALLAERAALNRVGRLADVGCGFGHWTMALYPHLAPAAGVVGVDREASYVAEAGRRFAARYPGAPARFVEGDALRLPLDDGSVDAVTCQTVLIHLDDPRAAIDEMWRVLAPGGIAICAEPNNTYRQFNLSSLTPDTPVETVARLHELWLRTVAGKMRRGLGCEYLGELLPGLFAAAGLADVRVYLNDMASAMVPPYDRPDQQRRRAAHRAWLSGGAGPFDREEARTNALAGGATAAFFDDAWDRLVEQEHRRAEAIEQGVYHAAGGELFYVVMGRKPGA